MKTVKELREFNDLTQKDMAELLGLTPSGYAGKESNDRKFKISEALIISNIFGVPIDEIKNFLPITTRKAKNTKTKQIA